MPASCAAAGAAPRLLALRRPEGCVGAMLAYLPFAEDEGVAHHVRQLIADVGCIDGKADPALVKGLTDTLAIRRAAAAAALCQGRAVDHQAAIRPLLTDPDMEVRLRAALGLASLSDKTAMPVLISLLADLPPDGAAEAEDFLIRIAGSAAPNTSVLGQSETRAKARDAWAAWWKESSETADLGRLASVSRPLGFTLAVEPYDPARRSGRVTEFDAGGKVRWQIEGLQYPTDAQVLPGDRVLITEQNLNRVSERDFKGKILWELPVQQAFKVQRLRNGNTFVAGRQMLVEVDRTGKELYRIPRFGDNIVTAYKYPDGTIGFVNYQGNFTRLDSTGKELKTSHVPFDPNFGVNGALLTNRDTVLFSVQQLNKVTEYDLATGKVVWEAKVNQPACRPGSRTATLGSQHGDQPSGRSGPQRQGSCG